MKSMRPLLIVALLLVASAGKLLAQTNSLSSPFNSPFDERIKDKEEMLRLYNESNWTIQASVSANDNIVQLFYFGHTNATVFIPVPEQQFDFSLFSMDGKEIPKASGYKFGQKLQPDKSLLNGDTCSVDAYSDSFSDNLYARYIDFTNCNWSHHWKFDVLKLFQVEKAGEYRLRVSVRLFTKETNGVFQPFILLPVETKVRILASGPGG